MTPSILQTTSRIQVLDFIRGFALLGILAINIQTYSLFAFLRPEQVYAFGLDQPETYAPTQFFIHLFFKGQFYTLYSFLFGLGFYLMGQKNQQAGRDANRLFKRRLWGLLLLGVIHAFIFWFGDILHKYALLGFTLIYFNQKSVFTLLKWVMGLALLVILCQTVNTLFFPATPQQLARNQQEFDAVISQVITTWQHGSLLQVMSLQKLGVLMLHLKAVQQGLASYAHYLIMFLLGLMAGKLHLFQHLARFKLSLLRIALLVFPLAVVLKALSGLPLFGIHLLPSHQLAAEKLLFSLAEFIGTPLLTLVLLMELTLCWPHLPARFVGWIANTGRMGLTNYLLQTLLCMVLFYGYAGGLAGKVTLLETLGIVLLLYGFQVGYSNVWLRYHSMGPMEKLWRRWTYGQLQATKIKRVKAPAAR
ncbi:hypothetical protein AHMF7605_28520 [Adhaeribacter arboris]|uniref:DUF418 domain-containing protein n=1 Tax=Adhaeribacter arboris TaxID=2072846 RepID=A0A2T2Y8L3_9BACT|nr:DUF418 domain-containing protein [Adhaeribacter arboris]PSR51861.1 hypothetical protein AHMF7605_28520 [Adhaeribacter arboris]